MKKTTLIVSLILTGCNSFAQTTAIDSLEKKLIQHPQKDTFRLNMLTDLAYYYQFNDPARGIERADTAIALAVFLDNEKKLATAYDYKGLNYASQGKDSLAIFWISKSLAIHKQRNEPKAEAVTLHNMGISYANNSNYPKALACQQEAYHILKKLDNKAGMAATLNSIGVVYLFLSDYPRALDYYLQALQLYEAMHDKHNEGVAYTNIGLVYHHASDYKKSLQYQLKALEIFKETADDYSMQNSLLNIGNALTDSGDIRQALTYYKQAQNINEKLGNRSGLASTAMNTGTAYYHTKDYGNSLNYLNKALRLYEALGNKYGSGSTINYLVATYLHAGNNILAQNNISPSRRYEEALVLQKKGLKEGKASGNTDIQRDGWETMSEIYSHEKEYALALNAYKKYIILRDSISNDKKRSEIIRMSMQYDFDKKAAAGKAKRDKEKALALATIKRQRLVKNAVSGGAGVILLAGFISFLFYKRKRDAETQQREAELRLEVTDTEMKALRAQMNPHFIFNSLNSIGEFIHKHETESADYYLARFAALMRMILENSEQKEIPLADDLRALEIYMQLEALRLDQKFTYRIDVEGDIDAENTLVPPLLLQPFVENSIWHGIAGKQGKGTILIEIRKDKDMINCVVEDNGGGMKIKPGRARGERSLGMKITSSRIELLNKIRKTNASVNLLSPSEGMRVEIKLPLILSF